MNIKKLRNILKKEEGPKLDFKLTLDFFTEGGKKEFAKDVCAIANSNGGRGYIIIGIKDKNKEVIGVEIRDSYLEERIQRIITSRCEPPIPVTLDYIDINNKTVAIITIYDGDQKPYQIKETGAFYIRRGSTTDVMRKQEILKSFEENLDLNIETCPVMKSNINFLNNELINKYFIKKGIYINKENKSFLLESTGITFKEKEEGIERCTYGGLLVFSEMNSLCISNNIIRIINKINKSTDEVTIIQGSLLSMIIKAQKVISEIIPSKYPIVAIDEAIKNAVLYREYAENNRIIEVIITGRSIVIESPGYRVIQNKIGRNETYIRRNMWIYEKLITLDNEKIFFNDGRGFSRMKNAFKESNNKRVRFINLPNENTFRVILPGVIDYQ